MASAGVTFTQTASVPAQARLKAFDAQVAPIVAKMTLEEKVGQMTQPDHEHIKDPADVATLFVGSVLSGGGSDPRTQQRRRLDGDVRACTSRRRSRRG